MRWRGHANLLYTNWLNYYVYQTTPYDINRSEILGDLGNLARIQKNWQLAYDLHQQVLEISRASGDRFEIYYAYGNLADAALLLGRPTQAAEYIRLGTEIAREMGDVRGLAGCLINDAELALQTNQYERTGQLLGEVLGIYWEIRDRENAINTLVLMAQLCTEQG